MGIFHICVCFLWSFLFLFLCLKLPWCFSSAWSCQFSFFWYFSRFCFFLQLFFLFFFLFLSQILFVQMHATLTNRVLVSFASCIALWRGGDIGEWCIFFWYQTSKSIRIKSIFYQIGLIEVFVFRALSKLTIWHHLFLKCG